MDIENENLVIMKKHNRKIVERAFHNSIANAKYKFPKTNLAQQVQSQINQSLSICSRVSQTYELYQQNVRNNMFDQRQRKIAPIQSIVKIKKREKQGNQDCQKFKTLLTPKKYDDGQKMPKRQFLSLTPKRQSCSKNKNSNSRQSTSGINLTKRKYIQFIIQRPMPNNPENQGESFITGLQKMTNKCFGNPQSQQQEKEQGETIFYDKTLVLQKYPFTKKTKILLSDKLTIDSTPLVVSHEKTASTNRSKHKRGMSVIKLQQNVKVSPFLLA